MKRPGLSIIFINCRPVIWANARSFPRARTVRSSQDRYRATARARGRPFGFPSDSAHGAFPPDVRHRTPARRPVDVAPRSLLTGATRPSRRRTRCGHPGGGHALPPNSRIAAGPCPSRTGWFGQVRLRRGSTNRAVDTSGDHVEETDPVPKPPDPDTGERFRRRPGRWSGPDTEQ